MMDINEKQIMMVVQIVLVISAVNWGLVAYNGMDLVKQVLGTGTAEKLVKYFIGLVGLYAAYKLYLSTQTPSQ